MSTTIRIMVIAIDILIHLGVSFLPILIYVDIIIIKQTGGIAPLTPPVRVTKLVNTIIYRKMLK